MIVNYYPNNRTRFYVRVQVVEVEAFLPSFIEILGCLVEIWKYLLTPIPMLDQYQKESYSIISLSSHTSAILNHDSGVILF